MVGERPFRRRRPASLLTRRPHPVVHAALAAALLLVACQREPEPTGRPLVITSFYPIYEFTREITGSSARVVSLVPPGVEPHDWEPSPQDVAQLKDARLFVFNGAGLDPWASRLVDPSSSKVPVVKATEGITLLSASSTAGAADAGGRPDPHVWLDPVLARSMVETIRDALMKADPTRAPIYLENARRFIVQLERLHEAFAAGLQSCARRDVVTSHAAFAYLARRYHLTVTPVMGLAPESEPSPAHLAAIARFARDRKVKYIFFETLVDPRLAETLAREVGAQTLPFNPIEGVTREQQAAGKGYVALMEENLKNLRTALDCR